MIDTIEKLDEILTSISGGESRIGSLEGRVCVAAYFGYMDARTMVFMKDTHGLPLSICAQKAIEKGLKIDFMGLKVELERVGKKPDTVESELREVRFFVDMANRGVAQIAAL